MKLAHFEDGDGFMRAVREGDVFTGPNGEKLVAIVMETCEDEQEQDEEGCKGDGHDTHFPAEGGEGQV